MRCKMIVMNNLLFHFPIYICFNIDTFVNRIILFSCKHICGFMLKHILYWRCINFVIIFKLHRSVGEITKEFLVSFCANLNERIPNFGKKQKQFALGNFLHPYYKGALLKFDNDKETFDETKDLICQLFKDEEEEEEEESPNTLGGCASSLVLKYEAFCKEEMR
jgi:hypothetical protein